MRGIKQGLKIVFAVVIVIIASVNIYAGSPVQEAIDMFVRGGAVDSTSVAVLIVDLSDGKVAGGYNSSKPLIPASIMKCVTTATLLEEVGEDWKYSTKIFLTGKVKEDVLEGNVIVEGSADPSLGSVHEPSSGNLIAEIVNALVNKGIKKIAGKIKVDESRFSGPSVNPLWATADLPHSYGTGSHGFNYEDNASGKRSVSDPSAVFISRLESALTASGIEVENNDIEDKKRKELMVHSSAPVDEIMRSCMMRSDNQFAEALQRTYSMCKGGDGSTKDGASKTVAYWKGKHLPTEGVVIVDGSGLSRSNRMTADFMGELLAQMSTNPHYASFFPLAGQEGTLRRFLAGTSLEGYVAMKTGSMNGIQCYAGYKLDDDYAPTHTIVVIINNMRDRGVARAGVEKMLKAVFCDGETKE